MWIFFSLFTVIFPYYGTVGEIGFIITGHDYKHGAVRGPAMLLYNRALFEQFVTSASLIVSTFMRLSSY